MWRWGVCGRRQGGGGEWDLVSFACMLVRVSPVCYLPLVPFSLGHEFLPESCFPYPPQNLRILSQALLTSALSPLPATERYCQYSTFYLCWHILGTILTHPRILFLASVGFPLPLASFCPLLYSSMKQFPSFFLPASSSRSASIQLKINFFLTQKTLIYYV